MGFFWTCVLKFIKCLLRGKKRKNDLMKKKLNIVFGHTTLYGRKFLTLFLSKSVYLIHFTLFFCFIAQKRFFYPSTHYQSYHCFYFFLEQCLFEVFPWSFTFEIKSYPFILEHQRPSLLSFLKNDPPKFFFQSENLTFPRTKKCFYLKIK